VQIILSKLDFCSGVSYAIEQAKNAAESSGGKAYCLHPIVHNKRVESELNSCGVHKIDLADVKYGDTVVINAHGCTLETENALKKAGAKIVDATCKFIKDIHRTVEDYSKQGYAVLIVGDKNHIEVQGIASRGINAQVGETPADFDLSGGEKFLIVAQSTLQNAVFERVEKDFKKIPFSPQKTLVFKNTICYTTLGKQCELKKIAEKSDAVFVVGDRTSNNCRKLCQEAKTYAERVFLIEGADDAKKIKLDKNTALGIIAGASTPKSVTMEVFDIMSDVKEAVVPTKITMAEAMKNPANAKVVSHKEGARLTVRVLSADDAGINVALIDGGGKNDSGYIPRNEAEIDGSYDASNYKPDTELNVVVIPKTDAKSKALNLSKKKYDELATDDAQVKKILAGEEFTLSLPQEIKGGLLGKIGTYTVFVPASHIRTSFVKDLKEFVNKPLRLVALPPKEGEDGEEGGKKHSGKRIVASQRVVLEREKSQKEDEFWSKIYEGAIVSGKVKRFAEFGAFVSLKYMDALVHSSDLSWSKKRINNPGEVLELNKTYDFLVLSADRASGKISLGYKQLNKRPVEVAMEKYPVGSVVKGKVARIVKFGAFVELEPGIDGLVHVSQIQHGFLENPANALKEGDEVEVKVMRYEDDKITLSIKELLSEPSHDDAEETVGKKGRKGKTALDEAGTIKERKRKDTGEVEIKEYVSNGGGVTLGDLFSGKLKK